MAPASVRWLGVAFVLAYSAVAASFGSFYPFSVFPMYARGAEGRRAGRLAVRTAAGDVVEIGTFAAFDCDPPLVREEIRGACGLEDVYAPEYLDDELAYLVTSSSGAAGGEPVEIVRRIWTIGGAGTIETTDCPLARCTASR